MPPALPAPSPSAPYFCCKGRQFHLYSGLMRHIKAEHRLKPLFYCEPCRLCVTTERAINKHREASIYDVHICFCFLTPPS